MDALLGAIEALSQVRNSGAAAQTSRPGGTVVPPPIPPRPAPAPPAAAPVPAPSSQVAPAGHEDRVPPLQGMFADGNSLLRAIIAAEVLGPPASLKELTFWNPQPNEPST